MKIKQDFKNQSMFSTQLFNKALFPIWVGKNNLYWEDVF